MAKVLVTMPDEFLNKVDGLADSENCSRSDAQIVKISN